MTQIREFLMELDRAWVPLGPARQPLPIIGSSALMLQTDYRRGTKDSDVLQTAAVGEEAKQRLLTLGGRDSALHQRHQLYIDVVSGGLPFLPQVPRWRGLPGSIRLLEHFDVQVLDVVDVVVSKLKRFHANDRADIGAMIERQLVPHALLVERFEAAVDVWKDGANAEDLPRYVRHLHSVERDVFLVAESHIALPSWI